MRIHPNICKAYDPSYFWRSEPLMQYVNFKAFLELFLFLFCVYSASARMPFIQNYLASYFLST